MPPLPYTNMTFPTHPLSLLLLLLVATTATSTYCPAPTTPSDISIFHTQSECLQTTPTPTPSPFSAILASASLDPLRLSFLSQPSTTVPVASSTETNNYVLRAKIGTPGQLLFLALDTGSDSAWVPSSCRTCPSIDAAFSPASSSTYNPVNCASSLCPRFKGLACGNDAGASCWYNMSYGADSFGATLSSDWLRLGKDIVKGYAFGCVTSVAGGSSLPKKGLLGLGRGPNGLLAQSGSLYQGVFSYCLPGYKSYYFSGTLRLGPIGQPKAIGTTPLLLNPHRPSLYYVNLTGVSVGKVEVAVPPGSFGFDPQTGAGTVVDSGTVITRFVGHAYAAIRDEFRHQVGSPSYSSLGAFDTCFETSGTGQVAPAVTFHLSGLDLVLPMENALIHSSSQPLACLAMAEAPNNVDNVVNVIASYQQQNHRVLIDVKNSKVGFARESCS